MSRAPDARPVDVDPFDLPETLGTGEVTWSARDGLASGPRVRGRLQPDHGAPLDCDLLAVDEAYPAPVADDRVRLLTHQAWRHGQIHLVAYEGRLTLLVPGTAHTPASALEAVARLAKALGASPQSYAVLLRVGDETAG